MTHEEKFLAELRRIGKEPSRALPSYAYGDPAKSATFKNKGRVQMERMSEREIADSLLMEWFRWCDSYRPALGAPRISPYCKQFQSSRQYDEDAAYSRVHVNRMKAVDWAVDCLPVPSQQTIGTEMRNRIAKAKVWRSPSNVPYTEALDAILPKLRERGLLD